MVSCFPGQSLEHLGKYRHPEHGTWPPPLPQGAIQHLDLVTGGEAELNLLGPLLDAGVALAILLAEQFQSRLLLIDDRRGRVIARRPRVRVVGLAGVFLAPQRSGLLDSVGMVLTALSQQGYRLSGALVAEILRLAGEIA